MHLYFYVRGIKTQVDLFTNFLQAQFWKYRRLNMKTNQEEETLVQGALRPSILGAWEYVFPSTALPEVLAILGLGKGKNNVGAIQSFSNKFKLASLRPLFGCKKIPAWALKKASEIPPSIKINGTERGLSHCMMMGIALHPIGIKEDRIALMPIKEENGIEVPFPEGYLQEWL